MALQCLIYVALMLQKNLVHMSMEAASLLLNYLIVQVVHESNLELLRNNGVSNGPILTFKLGDSNYGKNWSGR